jgi:aspartate oxidase
LAKQVEKVNPALVARDDQEKVYTVRYEAVNAMLLNEFLKEHRKVREQEAAITRLQKGMERVIARLEEQAAQIQKVSAQLEVSKSVPQMVLKNQR